MGSSSSSAGLDSRIVLTFTPIGSGSAGNLYLLDDGHARLAVECGLPFREMQRRLGFGISSLDGVLVSHMHGDHAKATKDVLAAGVPVFASQETFDALGVKGHHNAHPLRHAVNARRVNRWRVLPFELPHDAPGTFGFVVEGPSKERLLYVTDTGFVPYRFEGLNIIAIEANYSEAILRESNEPAKRKLRSLRYHMSLERVLGFLAANDLSAVREIWLLHLSDAHSDEVAFREMVREATGKPVFVAPAARKEVRA